VKLAGRKTSKSQQRFRKAAKLEEPSWEDYEKLTGEQFHRKRQGSHQWYYNNYKTSDLMGDVWKWMEANGYTKDEIKKAKTVKEHTISGTAAITCRMLNKGMPDFYKPAADYWDSLPGTTGELKPVTEFVKKRISVALGEAEDEEKEKQEQEEKEKQANVGKEKYVPSIQDRLRAAANGMAEFIEAAHDDYLDGKITDFKAIKPASRLRQLQCKQPHARLIKAAYEPLIAEYEEILNPPNTKNMTELEKDYAAQLKEGYAVFSKSQIKKLYQFYIAVQGACDAIIAESKANRKPRRVSAKSPEKIVAKLKYKISDDKYSISSVQPHKFIGANCLVVFNSKTRKLGIYYTSVEDPLGSGREGSGLNLKGQTLQRFDEKTSVSYTLRKPLEQLQQVKDLNTRKKFENWMEKLTTTPIKLNGRINPDTLLLAVY